MSLWVHDWPGRIGYVHACARLWLTLISILFGSALTMKTQYYMLDDGFWASLHQALADLRLLPKKNRKSHDLDKPRQAKETLKRRYNAARGSS